MFQDRHVQNFKSCLRVILSDERLMHGGKSHEAEIIDKCSVALNQMVELHYDKVYSKIYEKNLKSNYYSATCQMFSEEAVKRSTGSKTKSATQTLFANT